ncbi:acyl-CoA thioesterase [Paraburkholderia sp. UYCP14C]|uniref:acyl-CoA thioesterase n=1 Tax=Paraburkholderia sp. UYCP14C TaxID=2511130 RepID=UPI0010227E71|nr:thioesterase family protein [Paraburkholderia sp. UYCP14C]RZF23934.1 acyl-CoA thioesterase [Paraburkholderia sp. UYCP14C]
MGWLQTWTGPVAGDWIDELGHVNFLSYQKVADDAAMSLWKAANGGRDRVGRLGHEFVMLETHVRYLSELHLGAAVTVHTCVLAFDDKRFRLLHHIQGDGTLSCTVETVNLGFDTETRRAMALHRDVIEFFKALGSPPAEASGELPLKRQRPA